MAAPPTMRLPWVLLCLLLCAFVAFVGAVLLGLLGARLPAWTHDQLPLSISALGAAAAWWAARRAPAQTRRAWRVYAAGVTVYAAGDAVYNLDKHLSPGGEPPFPSWADAFYLLYAPLLTAALWRLLRPTPGAQVRRLLLDIGTVVVTLLVLLWHFSYAGEVAGAENLPGLLVNLSYPLQDMAMCALVLLIAFQQRVALPRTAIALLNLAFVFTFVADVAYAMVLPAPDSLTSQLLDVGFTFAQLCFGLAAVVAVARPGETRAALPEGPTVWSPYAAIVVCYGLVGVQVLTHVRSPAPGDTLRLLGDVLGTGVVTLLVVLRQNLAFRQNAELTVDLRRSAHELERRATHDALTGLPNRALLEQRLHAALAEARALGRQVGVLYLDLDRFKTVNDALGHEVGDELLTQVAQRLSGAVVGGDTLARQGGDEFLVLMVGLRDPAEAQARAERLGAALRAPLRLSGHHLSVTASLGLALFPRDGDDSTTLRRHADTAMYRAKAGGRDRLRLYAPEMAGARSALELEQALRGAVERGEFELHYQPLVRAARPGEPEVLGAEALLRWRLGGALVPPSTFVPLAEDTGLIVPLGDWVLREACGQLARWDRAGLGLERVSVNVSARQFADHSLRERVQRALQDSGVAPDRLELELTESLVVENLSDTVRQLAELRALGVRVALDDFGTGHSSLSLLRAVPADTLKIDQEFIAALPGDGDGVAVVKMVLALAQTLGLDVVAEGVETPGQWAALRALGCPAAQGHLFAHALAPDELGRWLRGRALAARAEGRRAG